jgi:exodeoxyribonuclease V alpha subunit
MDHDLSAKDPDDYAAVAAKYMANRVVLRYANLVCLTPLQLAALEAILSRCVADTYAGHAYVLVDKALLPVVTEFVCAMPANDKAFVVWEDKLYLDRYFQSERRLARFLESAIEQDRTSDTTSMLLATDDITATIIATINQYLPADTAGFNQGQRRAVQHALTKRLTVVAGGPGTGKTTTVRALLDCFRHLHEGCRIALVAPTGKAASRLSEVDTVSVSGSSAEVSTLHRLIGRKPDGSVSFDADRQLPHDLIVVDEASMVDLVLADQLIAALKPSTHLVLLGDANQLDAVETGTFFHELCRPTHVTMHWLCRLTHTYRFAADSTIASAATALEQGDYKSIGAFIEPLAWESDATHIEALAQGYRHYVDVVLQHVDQRANAELLFAALNRFRVLVAVNEGISGQKQLSMAIDRLIRLQLSTVLSHSPQSFTATFHGQALVFTKNNAMLGVNNGDLAIVINSQQQGHKLLLADGRLMSANLLQDYSLAWAMTVHKSQGSEFDSVAFVLPGRAVDRALLYTAVTRAKKSFTAYGTLKEIQDSAVRSHPRRASIIARLDLPSPQH